MELKATDEFSVRLETAMLGGLRVYQVTGGEGSQDLTTVDPVEAVAHLVECAGLTKSMDVIACGQAQPPAPGKTRLRRTDAELVSDAMVAVRAGTYAGDETFHRMGIWHAGRINRLVAMCAEEVENG